MSIQDQPSSSSFVTDRGSVQYDPFADDDDDEREQLTKKQKQESSQMNNGATANPVINNNTSESSSSNISPSIQTDEQSQSQCKSKSPIQHNHNNHSDHRSKSSSQRNNHNSSDRKRLRSSSPDSSNKTTVNNKESSNTEQISSRHKKSSRNDDRKKSKHYHRHRSSSKSSLSSPSKSPSSPSATNRTEKRYDEHNSHRHSTSRTYHSYSSTKYSSRDNSSSTPTADRRTNVSSPPQVQSKVVVSDGNSSLSNIELKNHETSTEDRNRIYNRLKTMNDTNTPVVPINNTNKISCAGPSFVNSNGGTQRSRSNLIQIVTTEATQVPSNRSTSSQVKPQLNKVASTITKIEQAKNTKDSTQSPVPSKTNGNTADDILMEEMLLEEEKEQCPVKTIDLDSLIIPESSNRKSTNKDESTKTTSTTTTTSTTLTTTSTSVSSLTSSQTKKPYTLYKAQHVNHMTPPLSSRHKKQPTKEPTDKPSIDDTVRRPSLDERLLNVFGGSSTKSTNPCSEQQNGSRTNPPLQTTTPSDKSNEATQSKLSLALTLANNGEDCLNLAKKSNANDERRSTTSKTYTTEWLATQKPEEAPTEELVVLPSLVTVPPLISTQSPAVITKSSTSGEVEMFGKLSEAITKLIQKKTDTNGPVTTTEAEDSVPISAKHLERLQRRKEREKRQSEIAAIAKEALKPAFKKHDITKDEYKEIMKKVVTKATNANEVDRSRIGKMVHAYIEKYRSIRQHNASKIPNGNRT